MSSLPTPSADTLENSTRSPSWKIKLLYDGECPLCLREVNFLQKRDAGRGLVAFVDSLECNSSNRCSQSVKIS